MWWMCAQSLVSEMKKHLYNFWVDMAAVPVWSWFAAITRHTDDLTQLNAYRFSKMWGTVKILSLLLKNPSTPSKKACFRCEPNSHRWKSPSICCWKTQTSTALIQVGLNWSKSSIALRKLLATSLLFNPVLPEVVKKWKMAMAHWWSVRLPIGRSGVRSTATEGIAAALLGQERSP